MTVIELGEISSGSPEPHPPARGSHRRTVRQVGVVLVTVLCTLVVTGSVRPDPQELATLWRVPNASNEFAVTSDSVYVLGPVQGKTLTAYDIADGSVRWARQVAEQVPFMTLAEEAGVLLLPATFVQVRTEAPDGSGFFSGEVNQDVLAVDARTGQTMWQQRGDVYARTADTVLLSQWDPQTSRITRLTSVRLADGSVLWSRGLSAVTHVATAGTGAELDRIITGGANGRIEVLRWSDGTRLTGATLPWVPDPVPEGWFADLSTSAGTVYVARTETMRTVMTAYTIDDLRRRWEIVAPPIGAPTDCGAVLCLNDTGGLTAYDRDTGAVRWRAPGWSWAFPVGPGRLMAETAEQTGHAVLDDRTGRVVVDLGAGFAEWEAAHGTMFVLRLTRQPAGFSSVTQIDPVTGASYLRGRIPSVAEGGCALRGRYLLCQHLLGSVSVTDVG